MEEKIFHIEVPKTKPPTFLEVFPPVRRKKRLMGRFGIEIETEVNSLADYGGKIVHRDDEGGFEIDEGNKYWDVALDNSLRGFGLEYILKTPLDFNDALAALKDFSETFDGVKFTKDSPSTSVHVHMNIQDLPLKKIANIVCTWLLFENLLMEFSGMSRRTNLFCLPMRCSEHNLKVWVKLFNHFADRNHQGLYFEEDFYKYSALNVCPISTLGSLEFRSFRGETDMGVVAGWLGILNEIFEFSMGIDSPKDLIDMIDLGFEELLRRVFPGSFHLLEGVTGGIPLAEFIDRNVFYVAVLYDSIEDWDSLDSPLTPIEKKIKGFSPVFTISDGPTFNPFE